MHSFYSQVVPHTKMQTGTLEKDTGPLALNVLPGGDVDVDLYGRGIDDIFDHGAEAAAKRETPTYLKLRRDSAMADNRQWCANFIERDLYGRGDPRVFGVMSTTNSTQTDRQPDLINTQPQIDTNRVNLTKTPRAFLISAGLLGKISCFSSARGKDSLETIIQLGSASSSSSPSSSVSSSPFPSSPTTTPQATEGSELAHTQTTKQTPSTLRESPTSHTIRSISSLSQTSKQTSLRRIETSDTQRRSDVNAFVREVRSIRPGETEMGVMEQGLLARLVHSLRSSGILSPRSSRCVSNLASYEAYSTLDQPTLVELPSLTPQLLQNPSPLRDDSANMFNFSSSDTANSIRTPFMSRPSASSPKRMLSKCTTSLVQSHFIPPSPSYSFLTPKENHSSSEKSAYIQQSSVLPSAIRSMSNFSSSTPSTNFPVEIQHPLCSSQTPSPSKFSFSDRSESFSAAASPSSPVLYAEYALGSKSSSPAFQPSKHSSTVPFSHLNSRIGFSSASSGTVQTSKASTPPTSSSSSNPTKKTSIAPRALSFYPGSVDMSDGALVSAPGLSSTKGSGHKRRVRVFQRARSLFGTKSSSDASHPLSTVQANQAFPCFGAGDRRENGTNTFPHEVSGPSSTSKKGLTVFRSPSTGPDSDGISLSSNGNMPMEPPYSNSRETFSHSGSHERWSTSGRTQSQSGDEKQKRRNGFETLQEDTQEVTQL